MFLAILDLPIVAYLSQLEKLFELLKASGRFKAMPKDKLMALAQKIVDSVDWLCVDGCANCLTPWGTRLFYITGLIRADSVLAETPVDLEDVQAVEASAHAHTGNFTEPKNYIAERMENEGTRRIQHIPVPPSPCECPQ
ncbi:hypothetical protein HYPSUDRAFT_196143 [Hypholoma sublateritium FD-334 SS-4]|uniref:Uncharacterized protein n=1 Tax=Hypholoma sublateritium (strain FD-334 SS-4) TaxID=945553 RepID=A0A0D2PG87_HYPSF|nr:hypothetical protein HYPSUDRAFT_196143 [Hypholoma sublateritium FD-334 SS-4]